MARPRKPGSKLSLCGMGLTPEEDKLLLKLIANEDVSIKQLVRQLIRKWMHERLEEKKKVEFFDRKK